MRNLVNKIGVRTVPTAQKPLQRKVNCTATKKSSPAFGASLNWKGLYFLDEFIKSQSTKTVETKFSSKALETGFEFLTSIAQDDPAVFVKLEPKQHPKYKEIFLKHIIPSPKLSKEQTMEVINNNSDVFNSVQTHKLKDIIENNSET